MKTIKLYGVLAERFGKSYQLDVQNVKEACQALSYMIPGFKAFMLNAHRDNLAFKISNAGSNVPQDQIDAITDAQIIHIMPKLAGSGGVVQFVLGAVLVVVGVVTGNPALIATGATLAVGGVVSMLMPPVDVGKKDADANRANYGFGGAVTTTAVGNPVPICLGERDVGGFIISAGIYAEDSTAANLSSGSDGKENLEFSNSDIIGLTQ